jgi:hypothetical protein
MFDPLIATTEAEFMSAVLAIIFIVALFAVPIGLLINSNATQPQTPEQRRKNLEAQIVLKKQELDRMEDELTGLQKLEA